MLQRLQVTAQRQFPNIAQQLQDFPRLDYADKKLKKVKEFIKENDKMIKCYRENGLSNEEAVKLRHKWYLDKQRMLAKLKELNIKLWECQMGSPIWHQEMHGNLKKIYYKGKEIIY